MTNRRWTAVAMAVVACGGQVDGRSDDAGPPSSAGATAAPGDVQRYPDVVGVEAARGDDGSWTFRVSISSPYDTPERYADGWRVLGPDGTVYGEHRLAHDHADEQPFTRTQHAVTIPVGVASVTIEGRDREYGYGGATLTVTLAGD